jgi:hypothetical protein
MVSSHVRSISSKFSNIVRWSICPLFPRQQRCRAQHNRLQQSTIDHSRGEERRGEERRGEQKSLSKFSKRDVTLT